MTSLPHDHFQGKTALEHLKEARQKGAAATAEVHGVEMPGHFAAGADAAKETVVVLLLLWIFIPQITIETFLLFSTGFLFWKLGRSAFLGWARLHRLHRLIEEERWEIQHHRHQEREELTELYKAKGFSGKLLEEVIDVLMADDDRLLRVMLEEELGLSLGVYEHPLKQGLGAAAGVAFSSLLLLLGFWIHPIYGSGAAALIALVMASSLAAKLEKNQILPAVVWSVSIVILSLGITFFLRQIFLV
jgi:vacuolar iron transporter family protein